MLQKVKDMYKLQREAKQAKKQLRSIHIEAESRGVKVTVDGEQTVLSIEIPEGLPRREIAPAIMDAFNRALKKAQVVAAEKMKGVMGELGLATGE
jgi:DNA-binding protein YbaB